MTIYTNNKIILINAFEFVFRRNFYRLQNFQLTQCVPSPITFPESITYILLEFSMVDNLCAITRVVLSFSKIFNCFLNFFSQFRPHLRMRLPHLEV